MQFSRKKNTQKKRLDSNLSPPRHTSTILENIRWAETAYALLWKPHTRCAVFVQITALIAVSVQRIFSKMALHWRRGDKLLNKVIIFVFFAYEKYSRCFVKLRLNPWCHMDNFTDLLDTFLYLDRVRTLAVYGESESFLKAFLNLCSKDERRPHVFETKWRWVINDII